ncbi:MAG: ABC transporter permease [Parvibaculaceae bacterium]
MNVLSSLSRLRSALFGNTLSGVATLVLLFLLAASLGASLLPVGDPNQIGYGPRLSPPQWLIPFGTDQLGRPILARVLEGIQITFLLSTVSVIIAGALGAVAGMIATYFHHWTDEFAGRIADIMFSFPPILLGMLVVAVAGPGVTSAMMVIALITFPTMLRVVRAATMNVVGRDFILVAEVGGLPFLDRVFTHILRNVAGTIVVQAVYSISLGMLIESSLSFLGLGVQPPVASLGSMLRDGATYLEIAPWMTLAPGAALALSIMSINIIGDAMRSYVDPAHRF